MNHAELPEGLLAKADEVFDALTEQEQDILRWVTRGEPYSIYAEMHEMSTSAVKSAVARIVRKKAMALGFLVYLVGVHDARSHAKATGADTVNIVVSRGSDVRHYEI
jgi:FixJ family two-component response regulator